MKQLLMTPSRKDLQASLALAQEYGLGFEFMDFSHPGVLDEEVAMQELLRDYTRQPLPARRHVHGAFYDVMPVSLDPKIREISRLRIRQSIRAAEAIGAEAVVFHTNYLPELNTSAYIQSWLAENAAFWGELLEQNPSMNLYLENMFESAPDLLAALSERLCGFANYGVCLDYSHAALSKVPPPEWAAQLSPFARHVHLNDNDLISDLHLPWGDGKIPRADFYRSYEAHLAGTTLLIEVATPEGVLRSLQTLEKDGFLSL